MKIYFILQNIKFITLNYCLITVLLIIIIYRWWFLLSDFKMIDCLNDRKLISLVIHNLIAEKIYKLKNLILFFLIIRNLKKKLYKVQLK